MECGVEVLTLNAVLDTGCQERLGFSEWVRVVVVDLRFCGMIPGKGPDSYKGGF